jgi:DNA-binding ferritin-like protein
LLGGVSIAMGGDVAETTRIQRPPPVKEEVPVQIGRLLEAHKIIIDDCHKIAKQADESGDAAPTTLPYRTFCARMNCRPGSSCSTL